MADLTVFDGLRVLDLTHGFAGAIATMILADNGADVTRIEPPATAAYRGDPAEGVPGRIQWHRSKRVVSADLGVPGDLERVKALATAADVLVESFRPGVLERYGLGYGDLAAANPRLVYCSITGFGQHARYRGLPGYEGVVMARTGRMADFGNLFGLGRPAFVAVPAASFGASQSAIQGICAALHARQADGRGQRVEATLLQGIFAYDMGSWLTVQIADRLPEIAWNTYSAQPVPSICYIPARAADGNWIQFANYAAHLFWAEAEVLGLGHLRQDPEFAALPQGPVEARQKFWRLALDRMLQRTEPEWMAAIKAAGQVGADHYGTTQEGMDHPQVRHNGHVIAVHDEAVGACEQIGPLVRFSATPSRVGPPARSVPAGRAAEAPVAAGDHASGPALRGVTVIEVAAMYAAPYGPCILADLGARVIKVEPLEGDLMRANGSLGYKTVQGKECIALDLKQPEAQAILHRLVERADIFMHNYRPGVPERLGIDYESLRKLNPALIYLYAGAYGDSGPYASMPAYHPIPGAVCGGAAYQAGAGYPPAPDRVLSPEELSEASLRLARANEGNPDSSSAMVVGTAMLLGLVARDRHGVGQSMLTTMLNSTAYSMSDDWIRFEGKPDRPLVDAGLHGLGPLYRLYETADGWIFLACTNDAEWQRLVHALGDEALANDANFATGSARDANAQALAERLSTCFLARDADRWEQELTAAGVAAVRADGRTFAQFLNEDPVVRESGMIAGAQHPLLGAYWRHGAPVQLSRSAPTLGSAADIGQHTRAVLTELGYTPAAIADLEARNVIRCA